MSQGQVSDGYHTFDELYAHRTALWKALCRAMNELWGWTACWKSRVHSDGTSYPGWFVLGLNTEPGKQITYHLPDSEWNKCDFARELEKCPEFDGHTPSDVIERVNRL